MSEEKEEQMPDRCWVERIVTVKNAVIAFALIEALVILLVIYHKLSH